jgi:predicted small secreted protein
MKRLPLLCAVCLAAFAAAGCNTVPGVVGRDIADRLPALLGPADHYDAQVRGSIFDLARGKIDSVHIHGDNVQLTPALHVFTFDADATNIHADPRTQQIESVGRTSFTVVLDQSDMDNYLQSARPNDYNRGTRILLNNSDISYAGSVGVLGIGVPFSVTGTLAPRSGDPAQMDFVPSRASIARLTIPEGLVRAAVSRVNPVVDLSRMSYPVRIQSSQVQDHLLRIDGSADLSSLVGATATPSAETSPARSS